MRKAKSAETIHRFVAATCTFFIMKNGSATMTRSVMMLITPTPSCKAY
jgi:hypothetical protein